MPVWGYTKTTGPHTWAVHFPAASGSKQSPIDLESGLGEVVTDLAPLSWHYQTDACPALTNTGAGWKLLTTTEQIPGEVEGGPLPSRFRLEQIHMHWGRDAQEGSEHTLDGRAFPGEIHLVHWDCEKYPNFDAAVAQPGGLAVLGVFFELGEGNEELDKVMNALKDIPHKGMTTKLPVPVDPNGFLKNGTYWNYEGSLTTPPCLESVNWIVFKSSTTISEAQLEAFRGMLTYSCDEPCPTDEFAGKCVKNFRPPMPLCGRVFKDCC